MTEDSSLDGQRSERQQLRRREDSGQSRIGQLLPGYGLALALTFMLPLLAACGGTSPANSTLPQPLEPVGVEGSLFGNLTVAARAYCDGPEYTSSVSKTSGYSDIPAFSDSVVAEAEMTKPDADGDTPHASSGSSAATTSISATVDGEGLITDVQASGSGYGQGQTSNSSWECYFNGQGASYHGLNFEVSGDPVMLQLDFSLAFSGVNSADTGVSNQAWIRIDNQSTDGGEPVLFEIYVSDIELDETFLLAPGAYSFAFRTSSGWTKPGGCDDCSGGGDYSYDLVLAFVKAP